MPRPVCLRKDARLTFCHDYRQLGELLCWHLIWCVCSSLGWSRAPMVPPGHLRNWTRVYIFSQNPALSDLWAEAKSPRSSGPFRSPNAGWIIDLRQWRWPDEEWHQHEDLEAWDGTIRYLQSPNGRIHRRWCGSHHPAFPGPSSVLFHGQEVPQGCQKEAFKDGGGLSSQHKGGGLHWTSGEKPQQQALLCKKRQRPQQETWELQGQWGESQTGQSGGQTPQQPKWRHWSLTF